MRVLFFDTTHSWPQHSRPWTAVSARFRERGFGVAHLLNDAFLCTYFNTLDEPRRRNDCLHRARLLTELLAERIPVFLLGPEAAPAREAARRWMEANRSVGRLARAFAPPASGGAAQWNMWEIVKGSVCREARRLIFDPDSECPALADRYMENAAGAAFALDRVLDRLRPGVLVIFNGLFYLERVAKEIAQSRGIDVFAHENASFGDRKFFDPEGVIANRHSFGKNWRDTGRRLTAEEERRLRAYLEEMYWGQKGTIGQAAPSDAARLRQEYGIAEGQSVGLLLGQVPYDTVMTYDSRAFPTLGAFVERAVAVFAARPEAALVVRFHPFEAVTNGDRTFKEFSARSLPPNVRLIHGQQCNTYSLMRMADFGMASTSQAGLEMASMHKPVIVVGDAFYGAKGFTADTATPAEFAAAAAALIGGGAMSEGQRRVVDAFLYEYIFDYLIPFDRPREAFPDDAIDRMAERIERLCGSGVPADFPPPDCAAPADYAPAGGADDDHALVAAMALRRQGRAAAAREGLERILAGFPHDEAARRELAELLQETGEAGEARRHFALLPASAPIIEIAPHRFRLNSGTPPAAGLFVLATAPADCLRVALSELDDPPAAILAKASMEIGENAAPTRILRYAGGTVSPRLLGEGRLREQLLEIAPAACLVLLSNDSGAGYENVFDLAAEAGISDIWIRALSGGYYRAATRKCPTGVKGTRGAANCR